MESTQLFQMSEEITRALGPGDSSDSGSDWGGGAIIDEDSFDGSVGYDEDFDGETDLDDDLRDDGPDAFAARIDGV